MRVVCSDESRLRWKILVQITTFPQQWHNKGTLEEQIGERTLHNSYLATNMEGHYLYNSSSSFQEAIALGFEAGGRFPSTVF